MLSFKQICDNVFPNQQPSPKCSLCSNLHTFGYVHTVNHRNTLALMAACEQCLPQIASGGFLSARTGLTVCPQSRKDMPSAIKHCQP